MRTTHTGSGSQRNPLTVALLTAALAVLVLGGCQTTKESTETGAANAASYDALMRIADTTRSQGDLYTASTLYRRAHAANAKRIEPLVALGGVLTDMGSPREALDPWRQALARDSGNVAALRGYGRALLALDQPEEAARQYAAALAASPKDTAALNGLGVAKDMMGDHAGAQAQFHAALALAPDDAVTLNNLGFSLVLAGNPAEAIRILEPLARSATAGAVERQNLALAYGIAGRDQDAARMARLDLAEEAVQRNLAYYRQARDAAAVPAQLAMVPERAPPPLAVETRQPPPALPPAPNQFVTARPAPASPPTADGVRIDLASFPSEARAREEWQWLAKKHGTLFAGREPVFVTQARASDGKPLVHVRVAFPDKAEAERVCAALRSPKQGCVVLRPPNTPQG